MAGILRGPRKAALVIIALVLASASAMALAESYRGLYLWASHHGLAGFWATGWPLMVDTFLVVGELTLFVALVDRWSPRARTPAWGITLAGLCVSVAGNVGHVQSNSALVRATAAVPPLAAAAALAVGLGVLKRTVERHHEAAIAEQSDTPSGTGNDQVMTAQPVPVTTEPEPAVTAEPVARSAARPAKQQHRKGRSGGGGSLADRQARRAALEAEAMTVLALEPEIGPTALAGKLGCSTSTAQRILRELRAREPAI